MKVSVFSVEKKCRVCRCAIVSSFFLCVLDDCGGKCHINARCKNGRCKCQEGMAGNGITLCYRKLFYFILAGSGKKCLHGRVQAKGVYIGGIKKKDSYERGQAKRVYKGGVKQKEII